MKNYLLSTTAAVLVATLGGCGIQIGLDYGFYVIGLRGYSLGVGPIFAAFLLFETLTFVVLGTAATLLPKHIRLAWFVPLGLLITLLGDAATWELSGFIGQQSMRLFNPFERPLLDLVPIWVSGGLIAPLARLAGLQLQQRTSAKTHHDVLDGSDGILTK